MRRLHARFDRVRASAVATIVTLALLPLAGCTPDPEPRRPNFLLIVADDLGYTDLGVYGGEIGTPNLDALAHEGIRFTDFHTASTCSPTRAMLLSGVDNHVAGLGTMTGDHAPNQVGAPGYETYLNFRVATLAELLGDAGYRTYMTGKWHLGSEDHTGAAARGFQRSFTLANGGAGHLDALPLFSGDRPPLYRDDGEPTALPDDFYSTRFYAEKMIEYFEQDRDDDRPFLAYLAFTAPHWPLQAPDESIARFRGRYDDGYDALHAGRLARLKELGLIEQDAEPYPRLSAEPAWDELTDDERRIESRKMEIYAAMVHDLDRYVGSVVDHLKQIGEYENTLILFMSDNGAEGHRVQQVWRQVRDWVAECCDNSYENMGRGDSYIDYGPSWARAGVGVSRGYKAFANEGGIRAPAFVTWPGELAGGRIHRGFVSVLDVMPTLLDLAGVAHPGTRYRDRDIRPMQGASMAPMLRGESESVHGPEYFMGWELFEKRAVRRGDWKLVWTPAPFGPEEWQLYDLASDPGETRDRSDELPVLRDELLALWDRYAEENGVILGKSPSPY